MNTCYDEILTEFINETNCPIEIATDILAGTKWNLNEALNFFYDSETCFGKGNDNDIGTDLMANDDNSKYSEKLFFAKEKKKWLCVYLSNKTNAEIMLKKNYDDYFVCFETNVNCSDGKWIKEKFKIVEVPNLLIIDPETNSVIKNTNIQQKEKIYSFISKFLDANKKQHNHDVSNIVIDLYTDSETESNKTELKNSEEETDKLYNLLIKTSQNKLLKIKINSGLSIKILYQKISSLININLFELYLNSFNNKLSFDDENKTIKSIIPDNSVILVQLTNI